MLHLATDLARQLEYLLGGLLYYLLSYENISFPQKKFSSEFFCSKLDLSCQQQEHTYTPYLEFYCYSLPRNYLNNLTDLDQTGFSR